MIAPPGHSDTPAHANQSTALDFSAGTAGAVLFLFVAMAASLSWLSDATPGGAALKIVVAAIAVGVIPGAVVTFLWRPQPTLGLLELAAISIAISFGIVHLLTVGMILVHAGVPSVAVALLAVSAAGALWLLYAHRTGGMRVRADLDDAIGLVLLVGVATFLYIQGSPVAEWEDQVHVSIVRRMAALSRLTLDNFYLTPGVVYTYPFPSTHAFMAFVTRIAATDALFAYHKLRFFWAPAALLMVYLGALAVFGKRSLALAALVAAGILTLAGVFAVVEGSYWGQLAVHSHASDVAMAVLLPALLAVSYRFIESEIPRESGLMLSAAVALVFALTVVHIREVIQYLAYLGCFLIVASASVSFRPQARRAALLLGATLGVAAVFLVWHSREVAHITDLVAAQRGRLRSIAAATSPRDLLFAPAPQVLPAFIQWVEAAFTGITQWLLLAAPLVVVAFRQRALVWLIAASTVAYLLVMNVPALAIPYIYLTYYEILITPIRNVTPFLHLLAGPLVYVLASSLWAALRRRAVATLALVAAGTALGLVAFLAPIAANRSEVRFFLPVLLAWVATFLFFDGNEPRPALGRVRGSVAVALGVIAFALLLPDHAPSVPPVPVNVTWASGLDEASRVALERRFSLAEVDRREYRPSSPDTWVYEIGDTSRANAQALVSHPDVKDTHHIDRATFDVEQPPRPWSRYPDRNLLVAVAIGLWASGFVLPYVIAFVGRRSPGGLERFVSAPFYRRIGVCVLFFAPFVALTASRPLALTSLEPVQPFGRADTPAAMLPQIECVSRTNVAVRLGETYEHGGPVILPALISCPPDPSLAAWVQEHVAPEAVFALDRWNTFMPTMFLPQQVVAFSGFDFSLPNEEEIYPAYMRLYRASMRERGTQPFFNTEESLAERKAFVNALGVTHVLVDPQFYGTLRPVLDVLPQMFSLRFADGRWAVYEVNRGS
jgi:hypothetical protein